MNEILKKKIEEGMVDYADNLYPKYFPQHSIARAAFHAGAEYAISHQWISVEDALPEANENVLALIGGVPVVAKGYHVRARIRDISHWMPIPKFNPDKPNNP